MTGKSWQPRHEPYAQRKTGICHTDKTVEKWGGGGGEAFLGLKNLLANACLAYSVGTSNVP